MCSEPAPRSASPTREDLGRGFRSTDDPEFRAPNPSDQVPVVIDGDAVLRESNAIRYLATKHGAEGLYPSDPAARARRAVDGLVRL